MKKLAHGGYSLVDRFTLRAIDILHGRKAEKPTPDPHGNREQRRRAQRGKR